VYRILYALILCLCLSEGYTWNLQGHQVVAQIAYDQLTPQAKNMCAKYLNSRSKKLSNSAFIKAAIWLDLIKFKNIHRYDTVHYINIPFSTDGTNGFSIESRNVIWGINNAMSVLSIKKTKKRNKRLALLILIHLVGDIHQPLHAVTKVSKQLPQGDLGGNLFRLGPNKVGGNLHQYWDRGAGFYMGSARINQIKNKAYGLEQKWTCAEFNNQSQPKLWAKESYQLAVTQAYQINPKETPSLRYQLNAQNSVQKRTFIAGCRLASLLNNLALNAAWMEAQPQSGKYVA
jgi:hypothetical protein